MKASPIGRTLLTFLLTTLLAHADEGRLSIRTLALEAQDLPEWHLQTGEDKFEKIDWPDSQPSPALTAPAGKELVLFERVAAGEEPTHEAVMKLALPEGAKEILLLASSADEDAGIQVIAIPDRYKQADFRDWLVVNRSERKVSLRYGKDKEPIELEAGQSGIYRIEPGETQGGEAVAHAEVKDKMLKIYSTFWGAPDNQRSLVLFYDKDKRVKLHRIKDFLPAKPAGE